MIRKQVKQITMRRGRYDWKGEMDFTRNSEVPVLLAHEEERGEAVRKLT